MSFLRHVMPDLPATSGSLFDPQPCYYAVGIKDRKVETAVCHTLQDIETSCRDMSARGLNAYHAHASFGSDILGRKQTNAVAMRAFWLDIDVGKKNNSYPDRPAAIAAVASFVKETGLTPSYFIDSGVGFYMYYCLDSDIPVKSWRTVAGWLANACRDKGFIVDPACTTDSARILRLPGCVHQGCGRTTEIIRDTGIIYSPRKFAEKLYMLQPSEPMAAPAAPVAPIGVGFDPLPQPPSYDAEVLVSGCRQLATAGIGTEPQWYDFMTVMRRCHNGRAWAHAVSSTDPSRYSAPDTDFKFDHAPANAPAKCATFAQHNPQGCEGCPHRGHVTSPVQVRASHPAPVVEPEPEPEPEPESDHLRIPEVFSHGEIGLDTPEFTVTNDGVVWHVTEKKRDGSYETVDHVITDCRMYYLKTTWTYDKGVSQRLHWFRVHMPNGNVEDIALDAATLASPQQLMGVLSSSNVFANGPAYTPKVFSMFINTYLRTVLASQQMAEVQTSDTFGWTQLPNGEPAFVSGCGVITDHGVEEREFRGAAVKLSKALKHKGSLETWKNVPRMYKTLDQKAAQLAICLGFAAPLMKYGSGVATSATFSLWSAKSGMGKTQVLRAIGSIWGDPDGQWIQRQASAVARMRQLAVLNHIPALMDELTDVADEDLYSLAYSLVGGQEKTKLRRNGADMVETGTWNTVTFCTSNKSIKEAVARCAGDSSASIMRVIEYECDFDSYDDQPVVQEYIHSCMADCAANYGLAGPEFIHQVLKHADRLPTLTRQAEAWTLRNKFSNDERFMSYPLALAIKAGRWAVEWGLLDYDMDALEKWVIDTFVPVSRKATQGVAYDPGKAIAQYLIERQRNLLAVAADQRSNPMPAPSMPDPYVIIKPVNNDVYIRVAAEERIMYIAKSDFDKWCKRGNSSPATLRKSLDRLGVRMDEARMNLGFGVASLSTPVTPCYILRSEALDKLGYQFEMPRVSSNVAAKVM